MVTDLPDNITKQELEAHFKRLYPGTSKLSTTLHCQFANAAAKESELYAMFVPDAPRLVKLVEERDKMVRKLESAAWKCYYDKNHKR